MIRVLFISRISFLSGRTNVYNLAKTCEAVNTQAGFKTTLVTSDKDGDRELFFGKMAIQKPFDVVFLNVARTTEWQTFVWVNLNFIWYLTAHRKEFDTLYFRDESLVPASWWTKVILRKYVFFEIHSVLQNKFRQTLNKIGTKVSDGMIAISSGLKRYYENLNKNIIISLCSAAENSWFDHSRSKLDFRKELRLSQEAYIVGYTGVVGANPNNDYYEVDDIVKSLAFLAKNIVCIIVGELNDNADWLRNVARDSGVLDRVIILPWQERSIIPKYLQAFDIILIPKRKKDLIGDSPAKMFPALAARRPIIAGQAECIEEVLTDSVDAVVVEANNPEGWSKAILKIYENPELAKKLSNQSWLTKDKYTWEKRGIAIAEFINKTMRILNKKHKT
ncbi:MAG: glycosyltransferase [Candidatus Zambryskibacteria bacterium]|nr:glycosyltransferase [Candidatus Zambryskibacteria bacterium]